MDTNMQEEVIMKKLMLVAFVFVLVLGVLSGPALADFESGIEGMSSNNVEHDGDGLHVPDKDGVADNPISIGGSGQN